MTESITEISNTKKIALIIFAATLAVLAIAGVAIPSARVYISEIAKLILASIPTML